MNFRRLDTLLLSTILTGALLFIYVLAKAYLSSFTIDESFSYLHYTKQSFMEIISFSDWYTNNHILNSLLMKYSEKLFGNSELALRLPNLLSLLVYMFYGYSLFKDKGFWVSISMFLLLCTNVLLMDFFGLARGYGLSFGFGVMNLFHLIEYVKHNKAKDLSLFHLSGLLATLSNFTLFTVYMALLLVYNLSLLIRCRIIDEKKFRFFGINKGHFISLVLVTIVLFEPIRRVLTRSELNFGGKNGFFPDTVTHLILNTLHNIGIAPSLMIVLKILFTSSVLIPSFIIIKNIFQKKSEFFEQHIELVILNLLLIILTSEIIVQHLILGSDFPVGRFSLFLFPLFMIHLGYFFYYISTLKFKKIAFATLAILGLTSLVSFCFKANLYECAEWKFDSETKNMIHLLTENFHENDEKSEKINLGINWLFETTINYYIIKDKIDWLSPVDRDGISKTDDYYYIFDYDLKDLDGMDYEVINHFMKTNTCLIKNNDVP